MMKTTDRPIGKVQAQDLQRDVAMDLRKVKRLGDEAISSIAGAVAGLDSRLSALEASSVVHGYAGVRNTTLLGAVDANGLASFLSKDGANNNVKLSATATPVILAISDGFDAYGAREYIVMIDADVVPAEWSGLTTNGTYYLWVEYDPTTGGVTYGKTSAGVVPADVYAKGAAGTATLHNFVVPEMKMYVDDGAAWSSVLRRIIGEVVVSGGVVSAVTTYALRGKVTSPNRALPSPAITAQTIAFSHNIGSGILNFDFYYLCITADLGYVPGDIVKPEMSTTNNAGTMVNTAYFATRLMAGLRYRLDATLLVLPNKGTGGVAQATRTRWNAFFNVERAY